MSLVNLVVVSGLVGRIADVGTTYLASPKLHAEANPVAKRGGWPYALATIPLGAIGYWDVNFGIMIATLSLLVAFQNAGKILLIRMLGEENLLAYRMKMIKEYGLVKYMSLGLLPVWLVAALGVFALYLCRVQAVPDSSPLIAFSTAFLSFAIAMFVFYTRMSWKTWKAVHAK